MTRRKKLTLAAFLLAVICLVHAIHPSSAASCPQCQPGYRIQTQFLTFQ